MTRQVDYSEWETEVKWLREENAELRARVMHLEGMLDGLEHFTLPDGEQLNLLDPSLVLKLVEKGLPWQN